jgi:septum formation protein
MKLILASQSPRRRDILQGLGIDFEVVVSDADETSSETDPRLLVGELSRRKALAVRDFLLAQGRDLSDTVILSSDTVVSIDGHILGKPHDEREAREMLRLLSGRTNEVVSGIALWGRGKFCSAHEVTGVDFDVLDEDTISAYIGKESPYDKAGAYAIQGPACSFISGVRGDYFNIVGLPVHRLCVLYHEMYGEKLLF